MGGNVPFGYDADGRTLTINAAEARAIRRIYALYRETGSLLAVRERVSAAEKRAYVLADNKLALNAGGSDDVGDDAPMVVFGVADIEAAHKTLLSRGVALEDIFDAGGGVKVAQGRDPEKNPISIEQRG